VSSDIRCPKCGEVTDLWDFDDPRDRKLYVTQGCEAVGFGRCVADHDKAMVVGAVADIMGDDLDGMASMLEEAESMGLL
jgi:hypothetical protein